METPEKKEPFFKSTQNTVRFTPEELSFVNDNLIYLPDFDPEMSNNKLLVSCFTVGISKQKPKEVFKDTPETISLLNSQGEKIEVQATKIKELEEKLTELRNSALTKELPAGAIVLNLEPKDRSYFWGVLQLMIKDNKLKTYEELLNLMFTTFHGLGYFKFTNEDVEYLKTLNYDGTRANSGE